jgi:phosphorylcholine metabolism protein LicD
MLSNLWDFSVNSLAQFFLPLVCSYFALTANVFLNTSYKDATGLEKAAGELLLPYQYVFGGQIASQNEEGEWVFSNRFAEKTVQNNILYTPLAAPSMLLGGFLKAISLCSTEVRKHFQAIANAKVSTEIRSNLELYHELGLRLNGPERWFRPLGLTRRPGDELVLWHEKEALKDIGALLDEAQIPWWLDCGTCLGAYRYGGVIPWDEDVDIAVLEPDFDNIQKVLNNLDPKKYIVQDWSCTSHPKSFNKIYVRKSNTVIDLYYYKILPDQEQIQWIMAFEDTDFFPEWVKIRERRFKVPAPYAVVFPLQRALFDGVVVNVPRDCKKYLQRCYGENLDPVKVFNPDTNSYEKDLSHPYWQNEYVH